MGSQPDQAPLIAIVGETASGKTTLAIDLAKQYSGEIIAADSRTIYKELSIGTAKPTAEEQQTVPHHLLDVVYPDEQFSVARFKQLANQAINKIHARGKVPFLVGGTGLYVDAVLYNFSFREKADEALRISLNSLSVEELQERLHELSVPLPVNERNPRHLIRALETSGTSAERQALRPHTIILGLSADREILKEKIAQRVDAMVAAGFIHELQKAADCYGWDAPGLQAPGYKAFKRYLEGELSLEEAKALFVRNDLQLAKRQRTWFKRNGDIHWICKKEEAVDLITTLLNKSSIA